MLVVCEIPYAKYLDCGMDMFAEIVVDGWLNRGNNSSEQKATTSGGGMIIRLQGFDRGVFGGNFHTHNDSSPLTFSLLEGTERKMNSAL